MVNKFKKRFLTFFAGLVVGSSFNASGFLGFDPRDEGYVGHNLFAKDKEEKDFKAVLPDFIFNHLNYAYVVTYSDYSVCSRLNTLVFAILKSANVHEIKYVNAKEYSHVLNVHKENDYTRTCTEFFADIMNSANGTYDEQLKVIEQMREKHRNCKHCMAITYVAEHLLKLAYKKYKEVNPLIYWDKEAFYNELNYIVFRDKRYSDACKESIIRQTEDNIRKKFGISEKLKFDEKYKNELFCYLYNDNLAESACDSILSIAKLEKTKKLEEEEKDKNKNKKKNRNKNKKIVNSIEEEKKECNLNKEEDKKESLDEILNKPQDYVKPENKGWTRIVGGKEVYIGNAEDRRDYEGAKANPEVTTLEKLKVNNLVSDKDSEEIAYQMSNDRIEYCLDRINKDKISLLNNAFLMWAGDQLSGLNRHGHDLKEAAYTVLYDEKKPSNNHKISGLKKGYKDIKEGGIYFVDYLSDGKRLVTYYDPANLEKPRFFLSMDHYNPIKEWYEIVK